VVRHFSVSGASEIAWLRSSVVLECNLKATVRASRRNSETGIHRSVDNFQKVLELLGWYKENRLLISIEGSAIEVEANRMKIYQYRGVALVTQVQVKKPTNPKSDRRAFLGQRNSPRPVDTSANFRCDAYGNETDPLSVGGANVCVRVLLHRLKGAEAFTISCRLTKLKIIFREFVRTGIDSCMSNQCPRKEAALGSFLTNQIEWQRD
jgi:hypothetical protein